MLPGAAGVEVDPVHAAGEAVTAGRVVVGDGRSGVAAEVAGFIGGEQNGFGLLDAAGADFHAVDEQGELSALGQSAAVVGEVGDDVVFTGGDCGVGGDVVTLQVVEVVTVLHDAVAGVEAPAADHATLGDDDAVGASLRDLDVSGDGVGLVLQTDDGVLIEAAHALVEPLPRTGDQLGPSGDVRVGALGEPVVQR